MARFDSYLGLPTLIGKRKYDTFAFIKEKGLEKDSRLEGEVAIKGWKGGFDKSCDSIYSHLYNGVFSIARKIM